MAQQPPPEHGRSTPKAERLRPHRHNSTSEQPSSRNKENLFGLSKKRVSSRILKIEFPINRPSRPKQQTVPLLSPLLDNEQNDVEQQKCMQSEQLESTTARVDLQTERWRGWRLRKCSNLVAPVSQNFNQQTHTHLRKRTLAERDMLRLQAIPTVDDPLAHTKRAIQRLIRDRIEGWEQSSNSDHEDSGPRRY